VKEKHTATLKPRQQRRRSKWKGEERKPRKKEKKNTKARELLKSTVQ
jgi:hypothetical protein